MIDEYKELISKGVTPNISLRIDKDANDKVIARYVVMTHPIYNRLTGEFEKDRDVAWNVEDIRAKYKEAQRLIQAIENIASRLGVTLE